MIYLSMIFLASTSSLHKNLHNMILLCYGKFLYKTCITWFFSCHKNHIRRGIANKVLGRWKIPIHDTKHYTTTLVKNLYCSSRLFRTLIIHKERRLVYTTKYSSSIYTKKKIEFDIIKKCSFVVVFAFLKKTTNNFNVLCA